MKFSWVILTRGDRPVQLRHAVESIRRQDSNGSEIVIVLNGCRPADLPPDCVPVELPENIGIPGGRNRGIEAATHDVLCFLDDDATIDGSGFMSRLESLLTSRSDVGIVAFQIRDPESGFTQQRHVPRVGRSDPARASEVTSFLGGACAIRRQVVDEVGLLPEAFFYALEETDLAWRALDAGWSIWYAPELLVHHPATTPARHEAAIRLTARNRVWLARRRLPWALATGYLLVWGTLMPLRSGSASAALACLRGMLEGVRTDPGPRKAMTWRTAWRMTRLRRPPVI